MQTNLNIKRDSEAGKYRRLYARLWHGLDLDGQSPRLDRKRSKPRRHLPTEKGIFA